MPSETEVSHRCFVIGRIRIADEDQRLGHGGVSDVALRTLQSLLFIAREDSLERYRFMV